ncbi:MAG: helix-turn-helix domain-containing protein, partial [Luminiphilus sp.]
APQAMAMIDDQVPVRAEVNPRLSQEQPAVAAHWARFFFDAVSRDWPGNSRDLRHAVTLLAADHDAPRMLAPHGTEVETPGPDPRISEEHLERVHEAHDYEVSATAAALGLSRQALYRRLQLHPRCVLAEDLTDAQVMLALEKVGSLKDAARALRVSQHALRPRLRRLGLL